MPRTPVFKTASIGELYSQLRYAPEETRYRLIGRAEELVEEIEAPRAYPEEFIVYRITSYRPDVVAEPVMLVGEALLADLATFVQRISQSLHLPQLCEERGEATPIDQLAEELHIATRTLRRYHKQGLIFHFVCLGGKAEPRLACYSRSLERFRLRNPGLIDRAEQFTRIDPLIEPEIVECAMTLHETGRFSRQHIARRLARKYGRGVETMRGVLARYESNVGTNVFDVRHRMSNRERRFIERAWRIHIPTRPIAEHLGRSEQSVARVVRATRVQQLRACQISFVKFATFALNDAETVILSPHSVSNGLEQPSPTVDLLHWIAAIKSDTDPNLAPDAEVARLAAYNLLKKRAIRTIAASDRNMSERLIDDVERDLRWAALIKRTLLRMSMPTAVTCIEQNLSRPLLQQPSSRIRGMVTLAIEELSRVIDAIDPSNRQTLARMGTLAIDRRLAQLDYVQPESKAGARHRPGNLLMQDPFTNICAWQQALELPSRYLQALDLCDPQSRFVVEKWFGLRGKRPLTVAELAVSNGTSVRMIRRMLRTAMSAMRELE